MYFNPSYLPSIIIHALRYFYTNYSTPDLKWSEDSTRTNLVIDEIDNFNLKELQALPRILVSRGQYQIIPTSLTDNLAESKTPKELGGNLNQKRFLNIEGVSQILIEASYKGTVEKIVDMTSHFLSWASPIIANEHMFKKFGLPMAVSPCTPNRDDVEIFQCTINIPWNKEEIFTYIDIGKGLNSFTLNVRPPLS